jgi:hypothetical protein
MGDCTVTQLFESLWQCALMKRYLCLVAQEANETKLWAIYYTLVVLTVLIKSISSELQQKNVLHCCQIRQHVHNLSVTTDNWFIAVQFFFSSGYPCKPPLSSLTSRETLNIMYPLF